TLIGGKVLAEAQGMPVLVETSRGKGRITYLSLDVGRPPLSQWDGLPRFLQNLLAPAGGEELAPRTRWDDSVFSQLILSPSFISTYLPTVSLFVAIVGSLIGIGLFSWVWQRQAFTRRALVAAFLFFVVLSTCGGYLLFSRGGIIPVGGCFFSYFLLLFQIAGVISYSAAAVIFRTVCCFLPVLWKAARMVTLRSSRTWQCFPPRSASMASRWNGAGWSWSRLPRLPEIDPNRRW